MSGLPPLTVGAVRQMFAGQKDLVPTLQVLDLKQIENRQGGPPRGRLILADSEFFVHALVSSQLNSQLPNLSKYAIIRVEKYQLSKLKDSLIPVVLQMTILCPASAEIGHAASIKSAGIQPGNPGTAHAAPAAGARQSPAPPNMAPGGFGNTGGSFGAGATGAPMTKYTDADVTPLRGVNPYGVGKFVIKARVTSKSTMRRWSNQKGEGKLFSVDLLDKSGDEMRATMFNSAVDAFFPVLQENQVYYISSLPNQVKPARRQYTHIKADWELTLDERSTEIELAGKDTGILTVKYDFVPIAEVATKAANTFVDVVGVVQSVGDVSTVRSKKTQQEFKKRALILADKSAHSVELTLWGDQAEGVDPAVYLNSAVAVKAAKVSDFSGHSLSASQSSSVQINPDIPEARAVAQWWQQGGSAAPLQSLSNAGGFGGGGGGGDHNSPPKLLEQIDAENMGRRIEGGMPQRDYLSATGTITSLRMNAEKPPWYKACPTEGCNRKVQFENSNVYRCEACNQVFPNYQARYVMGMVVADMSRSQWCTAFDDVAQQVIGHSAAECDQRLNEGGDQGIEQVQQWFKDAEWKMIDLRIGVRQEEYNGESRLKATVHKLESPDWAAQAKLALGAIEAMA